MLLQNPINNMENLWIVFPNQIFPIDSVRDFLKRYKIKDVLLLEHPIYFGLDKDRKINMNKLKLVLHRACFYSYSDYLNIHNFNVVHIKVHSYKPSLLEELVGNYNKCYYIDVPDRLLDERMTKINSTSRTNIRRVDDYIPNYCLSRKDIGEFLDSRKDKKRTTHDDFYRWNRQTFDLLMDSNGKPLGGTYSYDKYNRQSPPNNLKAKLPKLPKLQKRDTLYINMAKKEIEMEFKDNLGNTNLYVPVTFETSNIWLLDFIENRLLQFGAYQDAVLVGEPFMYHSVLSPILNCGLLDPKDVIHLAISKYHKTSSNKPEVLYNVLYSVEGFVRQILGWREWQRVQYLHNYDALKGGNYYGNTNKLTPAWYEGNLGILPIDDTIKMGYKYGYLHHILRLMYMSNFMNLCRIHPHEMYKWFMSFPMDSYDWVMVQNVYSMGAGSKLNMTKPYITTGNYIVKMSNYTPDRKWMEPWNALYYCFLEDNMDKLMAFPRVGGIMRKNLERKSRGEMAEYRKMVNLVTNK
jgi:deoxyribodipyrimidine photolyase-related protein